MGAQHWELYFLRGKKVGKLLTSHRSTTYPCFLPDLGEFSRSWSYKTCPPQKYETVFIYKGKWYFFLL